MANKPKAKGTKFESDVVAWLRLHGYPDAERRALNGSQDRGDIAGVPLWAMELKAWADLPGAFRVGVDQSIIEGARANAVYTCAIVKAPRKSTGEAYVVMRLQDWVRMAGDLGRRVTP